MRRRLAPSLAPLTASLPVLALLLAGCSKAPATAPPTPPGPSVDDVLGTLPESCSFNCDSTPCPEPEQPYACPALQPYDTLPHADACGGWDGSYPAATPGKCTASEPSSEAARKAGPFPGGVVLPDGRRIRPAGREVVFQEPDLAGGFPMSLLPLTGTRFALSSDGGIQDNALRLLDLDALAGAGAPVASYVKFGQPTSLFYGLAWLPPDRALASGGGDGVVYAFDVHTDTGKLGRAPSRDVMLGNTAAGSPFYAGAIATTKDGSRLLVAPSAGAGEILVMSLAQADYGKQLASIATVSGSKALFDLRLDPFDPAGTLFYATDEAGSRLYELDGAKAKLTRSVALAKNPEAIAFLDATYLVVASSDGDQLSVVDRASLTVTAKLPVFEPTAPHGASPSALYFDAASQRLHVVLAGLNAVEVYDVAGSPPTLTPAGRVPTGWWPTGVMTDTDGSLVVVNGKGHGTGTDDAQHIWGNGGPITERMHGSVQRVPAALLGSLATLTATADAGIALGALPGSAQVSCPAGANDFPVPGTNRAGPSAQIKHVILVVRENKAYDSVLGDRADLGDGDPKLIMASDAELQAKVWQNARSIASAFTNFDNFYTDAEQSIQGHNWTVHGRTTDFMERTWLTTWGRGTRNVVTTDTVVDQPVEGGVFTWLTSQHVGVEDMGEIVDPGPLGDDPSYPGLVYAAGLPDINKSCYVAGRIRLRCDLAPFTYVVQPNDHTFGGAAGYPPPEVMIAVNDEASGMLLDALSHSPLWKDSLLLITEDDPQDGGDHVDLHRSLLFMASPWVRRGYVSHGHADMASVYKLVAHLFGIPYNNETIRDALLPVDAFTSTPDFTPFTYQPRTVAAPCNAGTSREAREAAGWDFHDPDDQPGLSEQIGRMMKQPRSARGVRVVR